HQPRIGSLAEVEVVVARVEVIDADAARVAAIGPYAGEDAVALAPLIVHSFITRKDDGIGIVEPRDGLDRIRGRARGDQRRQIVASQAPMDPFRAKPHRATMLAVVLVTDARGLVGAPVVAAGSAAGSAWSIT